MKKSFGSFMLLRLAFLVMLLLLPTAALAQVDLYLRDSLTLQLDIRGELNLIAKSQGATVKKVEAQLLLFPKDSNRQEVLSQSTLPQLEVINYHWGDQEIETKTFRYAANVLTKSERQEVRSKIPFPVSGVSGMEKYLEETVTIDFRHPEIIAKATELAEGEDDLFKVAFKLASWVEENVQYDLNTLTEKASQKASWVLQNRQGVCDEMTSLFIAMARAIGIPARFVKGISYSNSPLFSNPWQPHGWAEVYFPTVGWVSFDVTFGEYGYVDVTHIKLRDGFDPADSDSTYQWVANNVDLQAQPLDFQVLVKDRGKISEEEIQLGYELLSQEIGFGSYNLAKATLTNQANYYAATTLQLAAPREVEVLGRNKRTILLSPNEVRETFWVIRIAPDLDPSYIYTFPALIYSEKNVTFRNKFTAQQGGQHYSQADIEQLSIVNEEKSYSRKVSFSCRGPEELKLGEKAEIACQIKNSGNANLANVTFCLEENCEDVYLPINQVIERNITIIGINPGWNKIFVSAENEFIEKRSSFNYAVLDDPLATVSFEAPARMEFNDNNSITVFIAKKSFSHPRQVEVKLTGPGINSNWRAGELKQTEEIRLSLQQARPGFNNKFIVLATWQDGENKAFFSKEEIIIPGEPRNFPEKIKMLLNSILNFF